MKKTKQDELPRGGGGSTGERDRVGRGGLKSEGRIGRESIEEGGVGVFIFLFLLIDW